jgi:hypothetical protein
MEDKVIGYCMKCKMKREMKDVEKTKIKPGRSAAKGVCTVAVRECTRYFPKAEHKGTTISIKCLGYV